MITTIATSSGTIHALEDRANHPWAKGGRRLICGPINPGGIVMRVSEATDAYVTCKTCDRKLKAGETLSAATARTSRLAAQLSEPMAGARR